MAAPHTAISSAPAVRETSTTTGTGTLDLDGAVTGFQSFVSGVGDGGVCSYYARLRNGAEWEWGIGTITDASPDTLARTTVLGSSNSGSAVDFSAGIKDVFLASHAGALPHVAASAPAVTDDNDGANGTFLPGSIWVDTDSQVGHLLLDDTDGAAVWGRITAVRENLLLNGDFSQWYRQSTGAVATADDDYFAPKWYTLIQGANSTVRQETSVTSSTRDADTGCRLTSGGTTNRFGIAQIVEARPSWTLQGRDAIFQVAMKANLNAGSGNIDVRIAILEWTGTADSVTSEVVNDWTSSDYTAGNFFASSNLTVVAVEQYEVGHSQWGVYTVKGAISNNCDNVIVMVWAEDVPAHADDYLIVTEAGLYEGRAQQEWRVRHNERQLCERFCQRAESVGSAGVFLENGWRHSPTVLRVPYRMSPSMRSAPSLEHGVTSYDNTGALTAGEMCVYNRVTGNVFQITGSLTVSVPFSSRTTAYVDVTAGTSWDGTLGDLAQFRFETGDPYVIWSAEL